MSYNHIDKETLLKNKSEQAKNISSKRKIKNIHEVKYSFKKIGNHLVEAANAGIDVVKENTSEILEDILDNTEEKFTIVIAGNNDVGKTTLLYSAKFGKKFNNKLIVPTVGYNGEYIEIEKNKEIKATLAVYDLGGGTRMGPLFYKHMHVVDGLVYVIRESDHRLVSSLWELYILLKQLPVESRNIPVCIIIFKDDNREDNDDRYNKIAGLSVKEALPPKKEKWFSKDYQIHVDKLWTEDLFWVEEYKRTASHGMYIPPDSPELSEFHRGSWTIMSINFDKSYEKHDAMLPFEWIYEELKKLYPDPVKNNILTTIAKRDLSCF